MQPMRRSASRTSLRFAGQHWPFWRRYYEYARRLDGLHRLTERPVSEIRRYWREIAGDHNLLDELEQKATAAVSEGLSRRSIGAIPRGRSNFLLYALVRALRPDKVVETGVAWGVSSSYLLEALNRNGNGMLFSIDLPQANPSGYTYPDGTWDPTALPRGRGPGWLVPERLRTRWVLSTGKSGDLLPPLLERVHPIDLFFHDSEHSYETMTREYSQAWGALRSGGVLVSDDIHRNDAFRDFATKFERPPVLLFYRGGIRK